MVVHEKTFLFLTLSIPGPSAPGNNIDVYMQPLIYELKELWDTGVNTYHASTKSNFPLRACLIWMISDFPAYENLSGWNTKDGKTKNHLKARCDLKEIGIRPELHPEPLPNGKVYLPSACFVMDKKEKEKFCKVLKGVKVSDGYAANISRSKPEGSIAEGYLAEECVSICSLYFVSDVETIHNKTSRNHDDCGDEIVLPIFCMSGRPIGVTNMVKFDYDTLALHTHIEHLNILSQANSNKRKRYIERLHSQKFEEWLFDYVDEDMTGDNRITSDITALANSPYVVVKKYRGYNINGFRFHIKDVEKNRTTQNSGVMIDVVTSSFSSASDNNHILGDVTYYGVLNNIIELQYADKNVVLFHCDWISGGSRIKVNENTFTTLDFRGMKPTKEPYILALQAQQVFYVQDRARKG
ncbi:uncharacterized protein [Rutidosis leptorrhynchoides]|uniref:uncharacterized protein n=1 Tax=Rutidosis leptorrhynchoides TaxID=125765 RepID=UPI003A993693